MAGVWTLFAGTMLYCLLEQKLPLTTHEARGQENSIGICEPPLVDIAILEIFVSLCFRVHFFSAFSRTQLRDGC
jgi:hypothetical protein